MTKSRAEIKAEDYALKEIKDMDYDMVLRRWEYKEDVQDHFLAGMKAIIENSDKYWVNVDGIEAEWVIKLSDLKKILGEQDG